jgi:hypothetical protein
VANEWQGVRRCRPGNAGASHRARKHALESLVIQMVAPRRTRARAGGMLGLWKDPEPGPRHTATRVFSFQSVGHLHACPPRARVGLPQAVRALQLRLQRVHQRCRQHHHAVLTSLAAAHHDDEALEIDVLAAQLQRLGDAHAGAVEQLRQHGMRTLEQYQHRAHLGGRQHHRQARLVLQPIHGVHPRQVLAKHLPIQEQQCRQRLPVRGHRHTPLDRQPGQEGLRLVGAHFLGMAQTVEANEGSHPMDVGLLRPYAVVQITHMLAQLV